MDLDLLTEWDSDELHTLLSQTDSEKGANLPEITEIDNGKLKGELETDYGLIKYETTDNNYTLKLSFEYPSYLQRFMEIGVALIDENYYKFSINNIKPKYLLIHINSYNV